MSSPNLEVPPLKYLLASLKKANATASFLVKIEMVALILMVLWLPWPSLLTTPLITFIIIGIAFVQSIMGYSGLIFLNKKDIRHLKDDTVLGSYYKQDLIELVRQVLSDMGYKNTNLKVYLLGDKDINASAIKVGFSRLFPSLNAIYLNRSVLHLLKPDELKYLMGHEFAHVLRYREAWRDYDILHISFTAIAGLWALVLLQATDGYLFFAVIAFQFVVQYLLNLPSGNLSQCIEYLCDYNGMQVSSLKSAVNASLKIGHESEAHQHFYHKVFEASHKGVVLNSNEIQEIYDATLPYGNLDQSNANEKLLTLTKAKQQQKSKISFQGWLNYLWDGDETNQDHEEMMSKHIQHIQSIPLLPWKETLQWNPRSDSKNLDTQHLLELIQNNPQHYLFQLETEIYHNSTHPSFSKRILFLALHENS